MSPHLKRLIQWGLDNNLEVVSWGLAPNPFGFCFESHGNASEEVKKYFFKRLEALAPHDVEELFSMAEVLIGLLLGWAVGVAFNGNLEMGVS